MFSTVATSRASTRSISGIYQDHAHSRTPGFVADKLLQLAKAPVAKFKTQLSAQAVASLSYTTKVFKNECLSEFSRSVDKSATDVMVHPPGEPRLTATKPLKVTLRRLRTAPLKSSTEPPHRTSKFTDRFSAVLVSFAVRSNLHNAKINTNRSVHFAKGRIKRATPCHQVELTIHQDKVRFTTQTAEKFFLIRSTNEGNLLSSCQRPDVDISLFKVVSQHSGIISDCSKRTKEAFDFLVKAVSISNLSKKKCDDLSGKPCLRSESVVQSVVQVKTLVYTLLKCKFGYTASGLICFKNCLLQKVSLSKRGHQLNLRYQNHKQKFTIDMTNHQERAWATRSLRQTGVALLPYLKASKGFPCYGFS